jgi:hypothetical protein
MRGALVAASPCQSASRPVAVVTKAAEGFGLEEAGCVVAGLPDPARGCLNLGEIDGTSGERPRSIILGVRTGSATRNGSYAAMGQQQLVNRVMFCHERVRFHAWTAHASIDARCQPFLQKKVSTFSVRS